MLSILRLAFISLLFLCSLLTVVKAPTSFLWKLSIVVMEWGHYFALVTLLALIWKISPAEKVTAGIAVISFCLFLSPLVRAYSVAGKLEGKIRNAFNQDGPSEESPISLKKLFLGIGIKKNPCITLSYKELAGETLSMDFYSANKKPAPCIVVIHGGSWASGDSKQLADINNYFADQGYAVAAINYRLAPQFRYPDQIEDVRDAISFLKKNALELGIDSSKLILLGRSAGGQLALQAAYTFNDKSIKGVISFYAPADMVWGYSVPGNPWIMDSRLVLRNYIGGACEEMQENYVAASPVEHIKPDSPPTLLIHGQADVLVAFEHSIRMNRKLIKNGVKHLLIDLPWATHGYDFNTAGPGAQISTYAIERFIKAVIKEDQQKVHIASKKDNTSKI